MTRQNSHRMTESMEEVMNSWDSAKEHRIQDKSDSEDHDHCLLGQRDIMFPKQVDLALNVLELLSAGHALPLSLLEMLRQAKKPRFHLQ